MTGKALWVPVASPPFWRFAAGTKSVEVREVSKPSQAKRWAARHVWTGRKVLLGRGYSTPDRLHGVVGRVAREASFGQLPEWAKAGADLRGLSSAYFDAAGAVCAFEVTLTLCACGERGAFLDVAGRCLECAWQASIPLGTFQGRAVAHG